MPMPAPFPPPGLLVPPSRVIANPFRTLPGRR